MLLIAKIEPQNADAIASALAPFIAPGDLQMYAEVPCAVTPAAPTPALPNDDTAEVAREIAEAIAPRDSQPMRREALEAALGGYNSFWDSKGVADPSLRNGFVAISKAMRPLFPGHASPIDMLARREKLYEPVTRRYLGTVYRITPLGRAVKAELIEMGALPKPKTIKSAG